MSTEDVMNEWDGVLDLSASTQDAAALEIGRALISAQRAASAIVAEARRQAGSISDSRPVVPHPNPSPSVDLIREALEREVDEIERSLLASQTKLLTALTAWEGEELRNEGEPEVALAEAEVALAEAEVALGEPEVVPAPPEVVPAEVHDLASQEVEEVAHVESPEAEADADVDEVADEVMEWGAPDPTGLVQVTPPEGDHLDLTGWGAPDPTGLVQAAAAPTEAAPAPSEAPPAAAETHQADAHYYQDEPKAPSGPSFIDRFGTSWMVNAVATAVVIVVLVITLLLVNTI